MTKINLQSWLENTKKNLQGRTEITSMEVYAVVSSILGQPREWLITHGETILTEEQQACLAEKMDQLRRGVPLAYVVGRQAFYGLDFIVTKDVLIPRPETELLVEAAIEWLTSHPDKRSLIDIGTGSGIIPITLLDHFPELTATAIDISKNALAVAQMNVDKFRLQHKITLLENDLLTGLALKADLVTANLPYIPSDRLPSLAVSKFEPILALDGGKQGFDILGRFLAQIPSHLNPGGLALLEIDDSQSRLAVNEATKFLPSAKITLLDDLAKFHRVLRIKI